MQSHSTQHKATRFVAVLEAQDFCFGKQKGFVFRVKILTCNRQGEQEPSNPEPSNSPLPSLPPEPSPSGQAEAHPRAANAISSSSQYLLCAYAGRRKLQLHNYLRKRRSADEKQAPPALVSQPWLSHYLRGERTRDGNTERSSHLT